MKDGSVALSFDSERGEVTYEGALEGTTMHGTCVYGELGSGTFEGRRGSRRRPATRGRTRRPWFGLPA